MMEKKLPVQIFSKRETIDERSVEGMGNQELPRWVLQGDELEKRAGELANGIKKGKVYFEKRNPKRDFIPLAIEATINEDAIAKSHRKKISKLFNVNQQENIIGIVDENRLIIKIDTLDDLYKIEGELSKLSKNAQAISAIEEIDLFRPDINISEPVGHPLKIRLLSYDNYELDSAVALSFEALCREHSLSLTKTQYTEDINVYKLSLDDIDILEKLLKFESIFSIENMPSYMIEESNFVEEYTEVGVKIPENNIQYPIVGVLDTGIENNKYLDMWIDKEKNYCFPEEYLLKKHGTFVAGIIAYGDELENKNYLGIKGCKVFDAAIFSEKEAIDQDILIQNIETTLRRYGNKIKIWNLSIGTKEESDIDQFSDFGMALDALQDKYDVLICKSAGNSNAFLKGAPKSRISKSADSVRAIVVGSIAQDKKEGDMVEKNYPSPFTRIGRGPGYIIKPDLVHYGGNVGIDQEGKVSQTGIRSFDVDGEIIESVGTSYSTPRVSSILAGVEHELNMEFDSLLLKGLVVHSAKYPHNIDLPISEKVNQMGFGLPPSVKDILYNSPNEVTLIMRDQLEKGDFIEILDFPFPDTLIKDGFYYGQVTVTVVYNPILDPTQGIEYCQSDLRVSLGTYENKCYRDVTKAYIKNPIGKENGQNILQQSCYSKKKLKSYEGEFGGKERLLIQYGDKYYPIKKYALDLEEMTTTNKSKYLSADRKWFLKIEGLFRDAAEKKAEKIGSELYQDFCVLITIKDPHNSNNPVYNEVVNLLEEHNFAHNEIELQQNIDVRLENKDGIVLDELIDSIMRRK